MQVIDVTYVYQQVTSVVPTLKKMREDSSSQFHLLFIETTQLGQQLHEDQFEMSTPRIVGRRLVILNHPVKRTTFESLSSVNFSFSCHFSAWGQQFSSFHCSWPPLSSPKWVCLCWEWWHSPNWACSSSWSVLGRFTTFSDVVYKAQHVGYEVEATTCSQCWHPQQVGRCFALM